MYGCALQRTKISAAVVKLEVIFVDGWERMLHFLPTGNCVHSAVPKTFNTLHCADLDAALEEKFERVFDAKLRKAQLDKGSKRSAAVNYPGHQKTPQFIAAVAMIAHNLCCGQRLFRKTMVKFKMNLLQSVSAVELLERGYDVSSLYEECSRLRLSALECGVNIDSPKRDWNLNTQESSETRHTLHFERSLKLTGEGIFKHPADDNELLAGKMRSLVSTYQRVNGKTSRLAVLRDRAAMSALQRVAKYIRGWNEETKGPQLFLMMNQKPTFDFAPVKEDAIQVIFMLTMPRNLEILGSLCLTAQRAIAPVESTTETKQLPSLSAITWWQFYCQHAPAQAVHATTKEFTVMPGSFYLPERYGPKPIDGLTNVAQFKSECVADPILRGTVLTWKDSTGVTLNPFNASSTSVIDSFIERMPQSFKDFQWINAWHGQDNTRGNMVYANLHKRPEELEKTSFIALGSLRSYPNQQFRKLQCALLDDVLPWSLSCVETIVRQTFYQIGDLTEEEDPEMLWKADMLHGENGLQTFCAVLKLTATKLEQTPPCFENIPLLSELTGHLHQFSADAQPIVKLFARMARRWATNSRLEDRSLRASGSCPFLGTLLSEARHFMHRYLSASSAQLCIFEQSFHRQIDMDARRLELMRDILDEIKLFGGIQLVSPADRMSLELKRLELGKEASIANTLDEILENDQLVDVLDVCNALLHHKEWNACASLVMAITDISGSLHEALGNHLHKFSLYIFQLLALRGLVAFGVLEHCMEKRYRVDFGLPLLGIRSKKIAIPFRAADVPSEDPNLVTRTFVLFSRYWDIIIERQQYSQWFESVKAGLSDENRKALGDVRHISLADARQFETLYKAYTFCMEAINFYLNTCVFPRDTAQYPQRLSRTAWNLAAGASNIGFSGTNDNHRLLPLSVTQCDTQLRGDSSSPERTSIPWQSVLLFATDKKAQALIDTGALLAGVSNHEAATFLLEQTGFGFAGVTYFDGRRESNCWMIAEKTRRVVIPLEKASMTESETFMIFDEARSRGFDEVALSILQSNEEREISALTALDVLNWVVANTKAESVRGLLEWASNGIHYRKTQLNRETELVDEDWSLETLYQEKVTADKIARVIESKARFGLKTLTTR
ncbi:Protein of unknown function DUF3638 [Phytophthora cactorum]|nr:Protein of unknown function DUF3638 [Phytophthora cactorum]